VITKNPASNREVNKYRGLARFLIEHHFGGRPRRIRFMAGGLSNFVFGIKHAEGNFVVRISPDAASVNAFIKEHWAQREAKKAGVPTAEILEVGAAVIPFPYMIDHADREGQRRYQPSREKQDRPRNGASRSNDKRHSHKRFRCHVRLV